MLDNITWLVLHLSNIFAHLCLFFAGFIAFTTGGILARPDRSVSYVILPWAACGIAMVGGGVNSNLFTYMRRLQKPHDESNQDRNLKIKFAFGASMFANVPLGAADFTIAAITAANIRHGGVILAAPGALAAIAGFIALGTVIADIIHLRGLNAQTHPKNIVNMPPTETDENI